MDKKYDNYLDQNDDDNKVNKQQFIDLIQKETLAEKTTINI